MSLSPNDWPKEDFDRLKSYTAQASHFPKPLAVSHGHGVVSGTTNSLAVHAGIVALQQGGNAVDACVATALTGTINKITLFTQTICINQKLGTRSRLAKLRTISSLFTLLYTLYDTVTHPNFT